jgi:mannose-6-phosphate isomerase-like protein (cupin superfamily)
VDRRGLAGPLGTGDLAVNRSVLDPGDSFSGTVHTHLDQEEVFYVLEGTATFEHAPEATGETATVEAGEVVRVAPGEYQVGRNESDEAVVALALGAPKDTTEGRRRQPCPADDCGAGALAITMGSDGMAFECPDCGTTVRPEL